MSLRPTLKASRPTKAVPELTGRENLHLVEANRIYHYGYKKFLVIDKIRELFGDRVAQSKKIRKAKIRDILNKIMHSINLQGMGDNATVDDFIRATEDMLLEHIAEIQAMKSSPSNTKISPSVKKPTTVKRKKNAEMVPEKQDVEMKSSKEKEKIDPIKNQVDLLADLMKATTDPSRQATYTVRQLEAKFMQAKQKDEDALKRAQEEEYRREKVEKKRRVMELNKEIRDDLTILLEKAGI